MYKKLKKYLAVLLCFSVLLYTLHNERQEAKAIAPALVAGLVVGAVALGGGIYFTHKEDLETVTKDCMDWLSDSVPDAYKELTNLVLNGDKYVVSSVLQKGILSFMKEKFGWGNSSEPVRDVSVSVTANSKFQSVYDFVLNAPKNDIDSFEVANFIDYSASDDVTVYFGLDSDNMEHLNYFFIWENDITDIYYDKTNRDYVLVYEDGVSRSFYLRKDGSTRSFDVLRSTTFYSDLSREQSLIALANVMSPSSDAPRNAFRKFYASNYANNVANVALNSWGFPSGVNVWASKDAYISGNKKSSEYYGVTGDYEIYNTISVGSNANLQTEDTAVSVDKVSDMTIEQFIEITQGLQQDNDAAWQDAISKITVSVDAPDIDVPDVDVPDNTSWLERIYNTVLSIPDAIGSIPAAIGEWGRSVVDNIKDLGVTIGDWGATWIDTVKDLGITIGDWFADLGITIGDYFVDLGITIGDWSVKIWDGLKDIPVSIGVWGKSIVDSIPDIVIPDYTKALDLIREGLASLTDIFVLDLSAVEFGPLVATLEAKFPIWGQIRSITTKLKQIEPEDEIPVIYIKTPPQFKTWIKTPEIVYVDLRPFKPFFDFCRVTLNAFIWFWVFRYIYKKFDFEITITP